MRAASSGSPYSVVGRRVGTLRPPFKCHGGKAYLKQFILDRFPPEYAGMVYVEPFGGAASVLLNKQPGPVEVLNDIHPGIFAIYEAIRDTPDAFRDQLRALPYSRDTFAAALQPTGPAARTGNDLAVNEYVLRRMSRGGLKKDFAWSDRLRGGQPGDVNAWETALEQIPLLSLRLRGVRLMCRPALDVLREHDAEGTLTYLDPPYLHATRTAKDACEFEMSESDHRELCEALAAFKGKVLVSGYQSDLYGEKLRGWNRVERRVANHSSQARSKAVRTEVLWANF